LAKTAKKAVTGMKDLPHEMSIPQLLVRPRDVLLTDASPGSRTSSVEGGPTSRTSAAGTAHPLQEQLRAPEVSGRTRQ
jgi:hypothetical protein